MRTVARWLPGLVACLLLVGCGLSASQRAAAMRFGGAAANLGAIAAEEFRQSRLDVIEMNTRRRALGDESVDPERLDAYFTIDDVAARVDAAVALRRYGEAIAQLAGDADQARIEGAGARLVASLSRLKGAGRIDISDERLGAIGRAVASVGGLAVESARAGALREVTHAAGPAVRQLAELIRRDFDPEGEHWSLGYRGAIVKLQERVKDVRADIGGATPGQATGRAAMDVLLAESEALAARSSERLREVGGRVVGAADAMLLAEKDLRLALVSPSAGLDDLEAFADRVADLVTTYRLIGE